MLYVLPTLGNGPFTTYGWVPVLKSVAPVCVVAVLRSVLSYVISSESSMPETTWFFVKYFGSLQTQRFVVDLFLGEMLLPAEILKMETLMRSFKFHNVTVVVLKRCSSRLSKKLFQWLRINTSLQSQKRDIVQKWRLLIAFPSWSRRLFFSVPRISKIFISDFSKLNMVGVFKRRTPPPYMGHTNLKEAQMMSLN